MNLSDLFTSVAYKKLAQVDIPGGSHQHEINGDAALKKFFGTEASISGELTWHRFQDDHDPVSEPGSFKFYDARAKSAHLTGRSEWRMYYTGDFLKNAYVDDVLILALGRTGGFHAFVFASDSGWLRSARLLFGVDDNPKNFQLLEQSDLGKQTLELVRQSILEALGIDVPRQVSSTDEELVMRKFDGAFPTTKVMSEFARSLVDDTGLTDDSTLIAWINREEEIFRALEKIIVWPQLASGFNSVDDFVSYSLTVQNRRKSRMGHAFEHHLTALLNKHDLAFEKGGYTENKSKPDFLFPGSAAYHEPSFDTSRLVMLGAKSTCKDRWRQVLNEAARIPDKHLCTLENAISTAQTDEMKRSRLSLVVPEPFQSSYTVEQRREMMTLSEFIEFVKSKQS